jgi:hypothetical protein
MRAIASSLGALLIALGGASPHWAHAEPRGGPVLVLGYADKLRNDLFLPGIGWRFRFGSGRRLGDWAGRAGIDLTFAVEPVISGIFGDETSVEVQVVPLVHLEPLWKPESGWRPYVEGGIGVIYTALEDLRLGSNVLFSDNVGLGLVLGPGDARRWSRVSVGYRYRHISHAGIFGEPNSGMNTHALVVTLD